eukprot:gene18815-biopygen27719
MDTCMGPQLGQSGGVATKDSGQEVFYDAIKELLANERPIWPGRGGKRTEPQTGGEDESKAAGKTGQGRTSPAKSPAGPSQAGREAFSGGSSRSRPLRKSYQKDDNAPTTPAELMGRITACRDLSSLDQVIANHGQRFDDKQVPAAMNKVAKLHRRQEVDMAREMMQDLSVLALRELDSMNARSLSSVLWALAKVGGPLNPTLVQGIFVRTKEELASFNAHDISNIVWAMATLRESSDVLIHAAVNAAERRLPQFVPQALANTLWALVTLDVPLDGSFLEGWIKCAVLKLPEFTAQALSNTLWAAAKLGIQDEAFIATLLSEAKLKLTEFNAQDLSNTLWAAAKLHIDDKSFIARWLSEAKLKLHGFNAQDLSNTLFAAAKLGIEDEAFIAAWLRVAKLKLPEFNPQNLSNSLWAAAKLGIQDEAFTASWLSEAKLRLPDFSAQSLSNTLWAAAKLCIEDKAFIASWLRVARLKLPEFTSQALSNTLWAADKLGWVAKLKLPGFNALELPYTLWAVAELGIDDGGFIATWLRLAKQIPSFNAQNLSNVPRQAGNLTNLVPIDLGSWNVVLTRRALGELGIGDSLKQHQTDKAQHVQGKDYLAPQDPTLLFGSGSTQTAEETYCTTSDSRHFE